MGILDFRYWFDFEKVKSGFGEIVSRVFFRYFLLQILLVRKNGSVWARQKVLSLWVGKKERPAGENLEEYAGPLRIFASSEWS